MRNAMRFLLGPSMLAGGGNLPGIGFNLQMS